MKNFTLCKKLVAAFACALLSHAIATAAVITGFDAIDYWVGTGSNRAALVIDWNDGVSPVSLAWGFRWDGLATGEDMFLAIAGVTLGDIAATGADARLSISITSYSFGNAVDRIVYAGSGYSHDSAGFLSGGYWEYYCMGGAFDTPPNGDPNTFGGSEFYPGTGGSPAFMSAFTGFSDRQLSEGSWDAWSFAPDFISPGVDVPVAAVPEPGVWQLVVFSGIIWVFARPA